MILQKEIVTIAETKLVSKSTIDKDWVLGHFLAAIYSEPELKEKLIFKGGTCLKKCYLPDYRFSEDLDFTSSEKNLEFNGINQLMDVENDKKLRASWKNSLAHQIQEEALPEFDVVKKELTELFNKIF